jgi:hypothetical protein
MSAWYPRPKIRDGQVYSIIRCASWSAKYLAQIAFVLQTGIMERHRSELVTASEIADFIYRPEAWRLAQVGTQPRPAIPAARTKDRQLNNFPISPWLFGKFAGLPA